MLTQGEVQHLAQVEQNRLLAVDQCQLTKALGLTVSNKQCQSTFRARGHVIRISKQWNYREIFGFSVKDSSHFGGMKLFLCRKDWCPHHTHFATLLMSRLHHNLLLTFPKYMSSLPLVRSGTIEFPEFLELLKQTLCHLLNLGAHLQYIQ